MYNLHLSPEAKKDLQNIKNYISSELSNPDASLRTVSKITKSIRTLITLPDIGSSLSSILDIRTDYCFLVCDNYLVFYRRENMDILVVRILYGKRDYLKILFE